MTTPESPIAPPEPPRDRVRAALALILLGALVVRVAWLVVRSGAPDFNAPVLDPQFNRYCAHGLVTGDWTPPPGAVDPQIAATPYGRPPLYPLFLAGVYAVFGENTLWVCAVQILLGLVSVWLVFALGRAWFGAMPGLAAALLMAAYWPAVYFECELNSPALEVLLLLLFAGALTGWAGAAGRRALGWALAAGALLGLHALIRPTILLPGVLAAGWMLAQRGAASPFRARFAHAAAMGCVAALVIAPAVVRNYRVSGEFILISSYGGINAWLGNNPDATGDNAKAPGLYDLCGRDEWNCFSYPAVVRGLAEKQGWEKPSFARASGFFYRRALDFWRDDPAAALRLTLRKAALFWGPATVSDSKVVHYDRRPGGVLLPLLSFTPLLALALLSPLFRRFRGMPGAGGLPAVLIAGHFLSILPFFVAERYRVPVAPFLALYAGAGLHGAMVWIRSGGARPAAALRVSAAACAVTLAVAMPWASYTPDRATWHYHRGVALSDAGDAAAAMRELETAVLVGPAHDEAWLRLGGVRTRAGDAAGALEAYTQAVAARSENAAARNNLGWELQRAGRLDEAEAQYRAALARQPRYALAMNNLGNLLLAKGNAQEALDWFRRARAANPDDPHAVNNAANALLALGDAAGAEALYREAAEAHPENADIANNLGWCLAGQGRAEEACAWFAQALTLDPHHARAAANRENFCGKPL